jgi:hypothetical protein
MARGHSPRRGPLDIEEEEYALFREDCCPADTEVTAAFTLLQRVWKHPTRFGNGGRYERHAWAALMRTVLELPPLGD